MTPDCPVAPPRRRTTRAIRVADRLAAWAITVGGVVTIGAIGLVFVYLVWVVLPLFLRGGITPQPAGPAPTATAPIHVALDEHERLGWALEADGRLGVFRPDTGALAAVKPLFAPGTMTAFAAAGADAVAFGFADGTIRLGRIGFRTSFPAPETLGKPARGVAAGRPVVVEGGLLELTPEGQLRLQEVAWTIEEPLDLGPAARVALLGLALTSSGSIVASYHDDGELRVARVSERRNLRTRQTQRTIQTGRLRLERQAEAGHPAWLWLVGQGDALALIWSDGRLERIDARQLDRLVVAETLDLIPEPGRSLTAIATLTGGSTLLAGDDAGSVGLWFHIKPADAATPDGAVLVSPRRVGAGTSVTALAPSARTRLFAVGHADGALRLYHATSGALVGRMDASGLVEAGGRLVLALAPKDDGLLALAPGRMRRFSLEPAHPEASLRTFFRPLWYEGDERPAHVWQSSSGTDDFEPKLGLMPLIFGTFKATFFSLLFGAPMALLAALFTSEFLHPKVKGWIKPTVELMASLPSVVLGFLAALVLAPWVERTLAAFLAAFLLLPVAFALAGYVWQFLPRSILLAFQDWRLGLAFIPLIAALSAAVALGPLLERTLFAGDLRLWLDGQAGGPVGGWVLLLAPGWGLAAGYVLLTRGRPWLKGVSAGWGRGACASVDLLLFGLAVAGALGGSIATAWALSTVGLDPRGGVLGTYVQRNALVVGFVMGLAIIPIIFTISEDALASVPEHLRSASLAAGATPWQTAIRIVVPTAAGGLFSALMIGLGRAVGETMIVLMAAGNTPIMEWNVFNGFRTLSANIAVELPEAVRNSTHYRTLFLAALVLFVLTFVINTAAELVRRRFRRRAHQL